MMLSSQDDDSCPPGCNRQVHEKVLELRDTKLAHEEAISNINKAVSDLNRTHERHQGREKTIGTIDEFALTDCWCRSRAPAGRGRH